MIRYDILLERYFSSLETEVHHFIVIQLMVTKTLLLIQSDIHRLNSIVLVIVGIYSRS